MNGVSGQSAVVKPIRRLLIANRGEIACRVMHSAKSMGISTVAVYSDADRDALHVRMADQAVHTGASPPGESYLATKRLIRAAEETRSDAVHPGYGFLSENAAFARACASAGIVFVGPNAEAIEIMGDKAYAKRTMIEAGVPCVPGYHDTDQRLATLRSQAERIGYPVMIKAAAGGGGRGMRLVQEKDALANSVKTARSEAMSAFGADELIIEKALIAPRHVEIQIFADRYGTVLHLGERDCSVQRRHQKVIEEAPCPVMNPQLRAAMGDAAVAAARAVGYVGAGTVEFLLDRDGRFYFLEMNTRLQVEHAVTECITGIDLVAWQLKVAAGEALAFTQDDLRLSGHAIEARLYAEDPSAGFLPSTGRITHWLPPAGVGIRVDAGVAPGGEVSPWYDPMLAKVIAWGATREQARQRLVSALSASILVGPATNRDFLIDALTQESFVCAEATTAFIEQTYPEPGFALVPGSEEMAMAAVMQYRLATLSALRAGLHINAELLNWSSGVHLDAVCVYQTERGAAVCKTRAINSDTYQVTVDDTPVGEFALLELDSHAATLLHRGEKHRFRYFAHEDGVTISLATDTHEFTLENLAAGAATPEAGGSGRVVAPMHGQLLEVFVKRGELVVKGQRLALLEAMKMQHELDAQVDGRVIEVHVAGNQQVAMDELLIEIEPETVSRD